MDEAEERYRAAAIHWKTEVLRRDQREAWERYVEDRGSNPLDDPALKASTPENDFELSARLRRRSIALFEWSDEVLPRATQESWTRYVEELARRGSITPEEAGSQKWRRLPHPRD